jgi:glycosyltransferase involved in cell wall biosynthesis
MGIAFWRTARSNAARRAVVSTRSAKERLEDTPLRPRIYFLASDDILKGRVEPILYMRTCEALSRSGYDVDLISSYYYRRENIRRANICSHYGTKARFKITILPTLLSGWFSCGLWRLINYSIMFGLYLAPIVLRRETKIFYSKSKVTHAIDGGARSVAVMKAADVVVVNSKAVLERAAACGIERRKIVQVYNAPFCMGEPLEKGLARRRLGIASGSRVVMYVGKIYPENLDFIMAVARRLRDGKCDVHVVGGNPGVMALAQRRKLSENVENVVFHGFVAPSRVVEYISASDILFCSFASEYPFIEQATPSKYFDFMYAGRPFACSNNSAIRELLADGVNCVYFEAEDAVDCAMKLMEALECPELLARIVENNRRLVATWNWRTRTRLVVERIEQAMEGRRKGGQGTIAPGVSGPAMGERMPGAKDWM